MENKKQQSQGQRDIESGEKFNKSQEQEQTRDLNRDSRREEQVDQDDSESM